MLAAASFIPLFLSIRRKQKEKVDRKCQMKSVYFIRCAGDVLKFLSSFNNHELKFIKTFVSNKRTALGHAESALSCSVCESMHKPNNDEAETEGTDLTVYDCAICSLPYHWECSDTLANTIAGT